MQLLFAIIVSIALSVSTAKALDADMIRALSAGGILAACKESTAETPLRIGNCLGQIQMLYIGHIDGLSDDRKFCPPADISIYDAREVIVGYIARRPDLKILPFAFVALDALKDAWPCKK
ncbi:MAG: Rap1a/Tai family immunity protein [Pseudolabrys sp.]